MNRIPEIDGLRGIAILMVVSFHYINNQLVASQNLFGKMLYFSTSFGWAGVDLFFVLSGYLIGNILLRTKNSPYYLQTFFVRRLLRIIPNYYLLLVIIFIVFNSSFLQSNTFLSGNQSIPFWSYFFMIHNFFMGAQENMGNAALSVTWSIGIEEQFYVIFPFLLLVIKKKILPFLLITFIVLANVLRFSFDHWIPSYVLLPCRADAISLGVLVAWIGCEYNLSKWIAKYKTQLCSLLTILLIGCTSIFLIYKDLGVLKHTLLAIFFSIGLIFGIGGKEGKWRQLLRWRLLITTGNISYSLYLFHYLILGLSHYILSSKNYIGINNFFDVVVSMIAFVVSMVFAWLVYIFLETPMVTIGKRFKY